MIDRRQRIAKSRPLGCSRKLHVRILSLLQLETIGPKIAWASGRVERRCAMGLPSARTTVVLHAVCRVCRAGSYAPAQG